MPEAIVAAALPPRFVFDETQADAVEGPAATPTPERAAEPPPEPA